jgi:hypothetical protein
MVSCEILAGGLVEAQWSAMHTVLLAGVLVRRAGWPFTQGCTVCGLLYCAVFYLVGSKVGLWWW